MQPGFPCTVRTELMLCSSERGYVRSPGQVNSCAVQLARAMPLLKNFLPLCMQLPKASLAP